MTGSSAPWVVGAIAGVCLLTVVGGALGLRWSRTTSDFYVASRAVSPRWNASAIGGEYLSAASFLGVAGLIYAQGLDMLWYPIGYTLGHLVLLVLVAAPLRRSGAYTLPDFAEARMESAGIRALCSALVVAVGWLYLLPQMHGAGLALRTLTGAPTWIGGLLVAVIVTMAVVAGGMRSVTVVQATQFWLKVVAIAVPAVVLVWLWVRQGHPAPPPPAPVPSAEAASSVQRLYSTYSLLLGLSLGTMGLPHVVVRFYTNPDGRAARQTTVIVVALLGIFYLFPPIHGMLARIFLPHLPAGANQDTIVLLLPAAVAPGALGDALTAIVAAGAFGAFLSTASGLTVTVAAVLNQDLVKPLLVRLTRGDADTIHGFRLAALASTVVPFLFLLTAGNLGLAATVGMAFAVTSSTFCPLLVLGVWWRRLSVPGVVAGMATGAVTSGLAVVVNVLSLAPSGPLRELMAAPAAWTVPLAFGVTIVVSLLTQDRVPRGTWRTMVRLHTPDSQEIKKPAPAGGLGSRKGPSS